jgi:aminoglycoside phosphotransferase (APT) family kinase protein
VARSAPFPDSARRWVGQQLGTGSRVVRVRRLRGASATAVHGIDVDDSRGRRHRLVLRRFVDHAWVAREPDLATREASVLARLAGAGIPTPELIGVDVDGTACDAPAVLATRLPGRIDLDPADRSRWLQALAAALEPIHAVDGTGLRAYARYPTPPTPPPWSRHPEVWEHAIEIVEQGPPTGPITLIHRDYHPLNTLWRRGRLTGVVDWVEACAGDPGVDVGHCRLNLAMLFGTAAADAFAPDADPYWDLASATGGIGWSLPTSTFRDAGRTDLDDRIVTHRLDDFVAAAVSRVARAAP